MQIPVFSTELLIINIPIFILGLFLLIKGSDMFIDGAAQIARHFNIPEIVIGLTLVSVGTSLPEFATDTYAAFHNEGEIVAGDLIGSNITNLTLILGTGAALLGVIKTPRELLLRDTVVMLGAFCLVAALGYIGGGISRVDGVILLLCMSGYLYWLFRHPADVQELEGDEQPHSFRSIKLAWIALFIGIFMITIGAKGLVDNVVWGAAKLGLSKGVIAATIVAFGTSLPELAVTVGGVIKKQNEMALGNIVGSCIFNLLLIVGLCGCISPITLSPGMLYADIPLMILCGVALFVFLRSNWRLIRMEGIALLLIYVMFILSNVARIKG